MKPLLKFTLAVVAFLLLMGAVTYGCMELAKRIEYTAPVTEEETEPRWEWDESMMHTGNRVVLQKTIEDPESETGYTDEIWLYDEATGKETQLLAARPDGTMPQFAEEISERYFAFCYGPPDTYWPAFRTELEFYDLEELRAVQIDCDGEFAVFGQELDGKLYFLSFTEYDEIESVFTVELAALDRGGPVRAQRESPPPLTETETLMETRDFVVFEKACWAYYFGYKQEIWLRDKATGNETLLLRPDEDYDRYVPYFSRRINERYFIFYYGLPDSDAIGDFEIYDIKKLRTVEIEHPEWVYIDRIDRRRIYLKTATEYEEEDIIINTYTIDIAALGNDGPIIPKKVR